MPNLYKELPQNYPFLPTKLAKIPSKASTMTLIDTLFLPMFS